MKKINTSGVLKGIFCFCLSIILNFPILTALNFNLKNLFFIPGLSLNFKFENNYVKAKTPPVIDGGYFSSTNYFQPENITEVTEAVIVVVTPEGITSKPFIIRPREK